MSEVETRLDVRQHMMRTGGGVCIKTTSMKRRCRCDFARTHRRRSHRKCAGEAVSHHADLPALTDSREARKSTSAAASRSTRSVVIGAASSAKRLIVRASPLGPGPKRTPTRWTIDAEKCGLCGGDPSKKYDFKDARLIPAQNAKRRLVGDCSIGLWSRNY